MDKKAQIHEEIMSFLNDYLENTPKDVIKQEIAEISRKSFTGTSAQDYFINFHKYYLNVENQFPSNTFTENNFVVPTNTGVFKNILTTFFVSKMENTFHALNKQKLKQKLANDDFNSFVGVSLIQNIQRNKYEYI